MSAITLKEHLDRAGAFARLVQKHRDDLAVIGSDAARDIPKAISIAQDFHDLFQAQEEAKSVAAAQATAPEKTAQAATPAPARPKPPAALRSPVLTARQAADHVATNGLTVAQRDVFDKAGGIGSG